MAINVRPQLTRLPRIAASAGRPVITAPLLVIAWLLLGASCAVNAQSNAARPLAGLREPLETGPGWRAREYRNAIRIDNRRGRDVHRTPANRRRLRSLDVNSGTGNGNYLLAIPILQLPGRRMPLSLNLFYNSLLWQQTNSKNFVFDHDHDWPAPGWSLGFGQIYVAGSSAFIIQDADATRHLCVGEARFDASQNSWIFDGKTNDGTLLDCHVTYKIDEVRDQFLWSGRVSYPDGTTIDYGASDPGGSSLFPTRIVDANGNYISIDYANKVQSKGFGPRIGSITDTLGRNVTFNYDSDLPDARLTSIVALGIGGRSRTLVRLHYAHQSLAYAFLGGGGIVRRGDFDGIDAIYFPGDSCGYWFDSYSSYGMITKVSQRCAMTFQPGKSDGDQGTISPGTMTDERVYNYPSVTNGGPALAEAPSYTTMTESWAGMNTPPSVTSYSLQKFPLFQRLIVTYPDGARHYIYTDTDPTKFTNGLVYDELMDGGTPAVLSQIQTTYELGDYQSPRIKTIQKANVLAQTTSTVFTYGPHHNQVTRVQELDYDGKTVLRSTGIAYVQDVGYAARHIFNLPSDVIVIGRNGGGLAETTYAYDRQPLAPAPSITNHKDSFDPGNPGYDKSTDFRGNITQIVRVTNPGNPPFSGLPEDRRYDIAGNLVTSILNPSQATYTYTQKTDYAYPEVAILASRFACISKCSISRAFTYDYNTGLVTSSTDANGRTTKFNYDEPSLRRTGMTWPTNATEILSYDDANLTTTDTIYAAGTPPALATETITKLNGLHLPMRVSSLADGNVWNVVDTEYDARCRIARKSLPYRASSSQPAWTSFAYDGLGRVITRQTADGSQFVTSYDDPLQPSSATGSPGETVRSTDSWGREKWYRLDGLGNLAEVVEPNPTGNG
jgi:YD repeat-containing protein